MRIKTMKKAAALSLVAAIAGGSLAVSMFDAHPAAGATAATVAHAAINVNDPWD